MDETLIAQLTASAQQLASAAEALENAIAGFHAQHQELQTKVDRIVAAIDEGAPPFRAEAAPPLSLPGLERQGGEVPDPSAEFKSRVAELERVNAELKAQVARASRKTLPPLVSALLAKNNADDALDTAALDKALNSLSLEQRIAVKAEMARAGLLE